MFEPEVLIERLEKLDLFQGLSRDDCVVLAREFTRELVDRGQTLCVEGQPGTALFIIDRGRVRVHKQTSGGFEEEIAVLGPGDVIGEVAMLDGLPASATATVMDPTHVFRLPRQAVVQLRHAFYPAIYKFFRNLTVTLCARVRQMNQRIQALQADPEATRQMVAQRHARAQASAAAPTPRAQAPLGHPVNIQACPLVEGPGSSQAILDFLGQIPIFRGLGPSELRVLVGVLRSQIAQPGEVICHEGSPGQELYIVADGYVNVVKDLGDGRQQTLTMLPPGTVFGELSLIDGEPRSATCVASNQVTLLKLVRQDFSTLFQANSPFALRFVEVIGLDLSLRLRAVDAQFTAIFDLPNQDAEAFDDIEELLSDIESQLDEASGRLRGGIINTQELVDAVEGLFD